MERTITVRSCIIDGISRKLTALGREKEEDIRRMGIASTPLFRGICIAPALEDGRLGYFSTADMSIIISESVAEECSEETVQNIFLHELAHALDYSINGRLSGHSAGFRECCRILGVDPGFEKSRVRTGLEERKEKKDRIRKLLALSSSPFENESAEAIRKAKMLMAKDGITLTDDKEERIYMVPLYTAKRYPFSIRQLLSYISNTTGVYIVISEGREGKTAFAYGTLEETEASIYLYDYLIGAAECEIKRIRAENGKVSKDSFLRGAIAVLSERTADEGIDNALIAIQSENMRLTKKIVFPETRIRLTTMRSHGGDAESYSKGRGFGSRLTVPSGIERRRIT